MLTSPMRTARAFPSAHVHRSGRSASHDRLRSAPVALAIGLALSALAASAIAQEPEVYQPPPLFSGQSHKALTEAGLVPPAPAAAVDTKAASKGGLSPAIQAMVEGKDPADAAKLTEKGAAGREDVPWVLRGDNRPWNLLFTPSNPLGTLYLSPPSTRDAKLMLPGVAADAANRARFTVNKYITDSIGISAQARARQMDALTRWIENADKQTQRVKDDEWEKYQFSVESRREIDTFRERVAAQAAPDQVLMQREIMRAVEEVTPLLEAMPNYELQMAWYNVLVQMKEGFALYQAQVLRADQNLLAAIDSYIEANPFAPRPAGQVPRQGVDGFSGPTVAKPTVPTPSLTSAVAEATREPAPAPVAQPRPDQPNSVLPGLGVFVLMVLAGVFLFFRARRHGRTSGKGAASTPES